MQGKIINGFEIKRLLGRGGMAEVWYAENEIGKPAAIKILSEVLSNNPQIVERFHNEALVMVKLNHPNIRQVYGYGYIGNRHCIVMEYLDGGDLEALMRSGRRFTDEELRRWWNQTVDALNYTHAMDIVHRDIKPSNIFLDSLGNIKLLDFGIAKVRESISLTQTGAMMGTLMYMSPEQVDDAKHLGPKSDAYSLAVTFEHLLTGKVPYDSTSLSDFKIRESIVYKPLDLSGVPAAWQVFLVPYLEKNPEDRPALRHFEEMASASSTLPQENLVTEIVAKSTMPNDDETIAENNNTLHQNTLSSGDLHSELAPMSPEHKDKPKSKIGLWIGLGAVVAVVAIVLAVLFMRSGVDVDGSFNGHDYVDLGLPSGTLWATCNVGAQTNKHYGDYFAWGETQAKTTFEHSNYKFFANGEQNKTTKYCRDYDKGNKGFVDHTSVLQSEDDAATVNWGNGWRTPTKRQWEELLQNTTNQFAKRNGMKGRLFTAKNGRSLFLPDDVDCIWDDYDNDWSEGHYWTSELYDEIDSDKTSMAGLFWFTLFDKDECTLGGGTRIAGHYVRPVRDK